jgi:hypothetical protein
MEWSLEDNQEEKKPAVTPACIQNFCSQWLQQQGIQTPAQQEQRQQQHFQ